MPERVDTAADAPPEDDIDARFISSMFAAARRGEAPAVLAVVDAFPSLLHAKDDTNGWTLLHFFSRLSLAAPVGALLKRGADPEARDRSFRSALHMAALADAQPEVALADGAVGASAAPIAEADRPKAIIATLRTLLKAGARTTARDSFGFTALHHAAHAGHTEAVLFLLSLNTEMRLPRAPLEAETNAEERPLHLAAAGGHATTVRLLLEHGAHTGKTNYLGQTPLHLACRGGDEPRALETARSRRRGRSSLSSHAGRPKARTGRRESARGSSGSVGAC
jgi:ankyrin repeat protein